MTQPDTSISAQDTWRSKEPTDKQLSAIWNMQRAMGVSELSTPKTRGDACDLISRLKETIEHNLMLGGSINPQRSPLLYGSSWDGFEEDM